MPGKYQSPGKVVIDGAIYRFVYDEDPNLKCQFGSVVAAHNGRFLVTAPTYSRQGRVFFGMVE
jgi:hypothetical protein